MAQIKVTHSANTYIKTYVFENGDIKSHCSLPDASHGRNIAKFHARHHYCFQAFDSIRMRIQKCMKMFSLHCMACIMIFPCPSKKRAMICTST